MYGSLVICNTGSIRPWRSVVVVASNPGRFRSLFEWQQMAISIIPSSPKGSEKKTAINHRHFNHQSLEFSDIVYCSVHQKVPPWQCDESDWSSRPFLIDYLSSALLDERKKWKKPVRHDPINISNSYKACLGCEQYAFQDIDHHRRELCEMGRQV